MDLLNIFELENTTLKTFNDISKELLLLNNTREIKKLSIEKMTPFLNQLQEYYTIDLKRTISEYEYSIKTGVGKKELEARLASVRYFIKETFRKMWNNKMDEIRKSINPNRHYQWNLQMPIMEKTIYIKRDLPDLEYLFFETRCN